MPASTTNGGSSAVTTAQTASVRRPASPPDFSELPDPAQALPRRDVGVAGGASDGGRADESREALETVAGWSGLARYGVRECESSRERDRAVCERVRVTRRCVSGLDEERRGGGTLARRPLGWLACSVLWIDVNSVSDYPDQPLKRVERPTPPPLPLRLPHFTRYTALLPLAAMPSRKSARSKKGKQPEALPPAPEEVEAAVSSEAVDAATTPAEDARVDDKADEEAQEEQIAAEEEAGQQEEAPAAGPSSGLSMEERMAKMKELRKRMVRCVRSSTAWTRTDCSLRARRTTRLERIARTSSRK